MLDHVMLQQWLQEYKTKIYKRDLCLHVHERIAWGIMCSVSVLSGVELHYSNTDCNILQHDSGFHFFDCYPSPINFPLCRLETVDARSKAGLAKIIGTLMSVGGATLLSLYKGAALTRTTSSVQEHSAKGITPISSSSISKGRWMLGSVLLVLNCISFSLWMLLQGKLTKKYPAVFSSTAFMTLFSSMQAGVVALTTQRRLSVWLIRGNIQFIAVVFAGVGVSGIGYVLMTWCIEKKGPVFTAGFMPLIQIMAAVIDLFFLHEQLWLGSVLGAALVIGGLYLLLWGKSKEASATALLAKPVDRDGEKKANLEA